MKKKVSKKKKICKKCKEPYKRVAEEITLFGQTVCLHDDRLEEYNKNFKGMPMTVDPQGIGFGGGGTLKEERNGKDSREKKYIEECHRRGNKVFRGSDGLLREIGVK